MTVNVKSLNPVIVYTYICLPTQKVKMEAAVRAVSKMLCCFFPVLCCLETYMAARWWPATLSMTLPLTSSGATTVRPRTTASSATWPRCTPVTTRWWGSEGQIVRTPCMRPLRMESPMGPSGMTFQVWLFVLDLWVHPGCYFASSVDAPGLLVVCFMLSWKDWTL